jgi:hypothetical protein
MFNTKIISLGAVLCALPQTVFAAGAYVVDDAGIVDAGMVQIESWYSHSSRNENLGVVDAAYQLLPHAEFTLRNGYDAQNGSGNDALSAQVKFQWREGDDGKDVQSSAVFGINHSASGNRFAGLYAYIPSTLAVGDALDINADLGWEYEADADRNFLTWGVGAEAHVNDRLSFIGEAFGKNTGLPGAQFGSRFTLLENLVLDAIYGRNVAGTPGNWGTLGLTATF